MRTKKTVKYYINKLSAANNKNLEVNLEQRGDAGEFANYQIAIFIINRKVEQKEKAA